MALELSPEKTLWTPEDGSLETGTEPFTQLSLRNIHHAGMQLEYTREQQETEVQAYNIWVPGFFGIHCAYANLRHASAVLDPTVGDISMQAPRKRDLIHSDLRPSEMLPKAVWGVMKDVMLETGVERFNLIGHSMGGAAVVNTATFIVEQKDPRFIKSVAMNASAGVTGHNILSLVPAVGLMFTQEIARKRALLTHHVGGEKLATARHELFEYARHPQTVLEMIGVSHCNILGKVEKLSEDGVVTIGLFFPKDPLFKAHKAEKNLQDRVTAFSILEDPADAGHVASLLYPTEVAAENLRLRQLCEDQAA
ncbi:hypothetical protein BH09PAT3_BH09PAT3_0670 [soil metagenome]